MCNCLYLSHTNVTSHCPLLSLTCHHQDHLVPSSCLAVTSHSCTEGCLPLLPSTYTIVSSSMHIHGCQTASVSPWKRLCHPVHGAGGQSVRSRSPRLCWVPLLLCHGGGSVYHLSPAVRLSLRSDVESGHSHSAVCPHCSAAQESHGPHPQ